MDAVFWETLLQRLVATRLGRRLLDMVTLGRARRRMVALDHQVTARCQARILPGLVHRAQSTRFGRDHDFCRIRTIGDFQRLVPLRTPAALWRDYWQSAFPDLAGATWPGPIAGLAAAQAPEDGIFSPVPLSPHLWAAHRAAARTMLALVLNARPSARLFSGHFLLVDSIVGLTSMGDRWAPAALGEMVGRQVPPLVRPFVLFPPPPQGEDATRLQALVQRSLHLPVTGLAGTTEQLAQVFARARQTTGRDRVVDIWPDLTAVLFTRGPSGPEPARLREAIGSPGVLFLEACFRPEGAIAVEDPRHGLLRLLPDHDVFFEFVPLDQVQSRRPVRHTAAQVEPGVPYAVALSSPAGFWACLVDCRVCFERRDPPLLRLLGRDPPRETPPGPRPATIAHHFGAQPPHSFLDAGPYSLPFRARPLGGPSWF
jgi:hypothetical protein